MAVIDLLAARAADSDVPGFWRRCWLSARPLLWLRPVDEQDAAGGTLALEFEPRHRCCRKAHTAKLRRASELTRLRRR